MLGVEVWKGLGPNSNGAYACSAAGKPTEEAFQMSCQVHEHPRPSSSSSNTMKQSFKDTEDRSYGTIVHGRGRSQGRPDEHSN